MSRAAEFLKKIANPTVCVRGKANASLVKASPWPFSAAERF